MKGPLAALLVAALAVPAFAQTEQGVDTLYGPPPKVDTGAAKAAERISGKKLPDAPPSPAGKAVGPLGDTVTRADILASAVMTQLLLGDYEVNAEVDSGLTEELKKTFVLVSVKPGILKKFAQRHYMSVPSGKIGSLPVSKAEYSLDKNVRQPGEVRALGKYLAIKSPDTSMSYFDLGDADEARRPTIYKQAGTVTGGDISGVFDAALLDDALAAAGFDTAALAAAKANLDSVRRTRGNPDKYLIEGSKKSRLGFSTPGHIDFFWPTIVLN